jgi:hypothetical protein
MTNKFNVVRAKKYKAGQEEKTAWLPVGTITEFENGNRILELNDRNETYQIFPFKKKDDNLDVPF